MQVVIYSSQVVHVHVSALGIVSLSNNEPERCSDAVKSQNGRGSWVMRKLFALIMALSMLVSCFGVAFAEGEPEQEITRELFEGTNGTTVRLAFNGVEFDTAALGKVVQEFVDETGYSVEIMYVPTTGGWGGYFNKLQTMIASGDTPDLIRIAIEGFHMFQSRGLIEPIDSYFETYPEQKAVLDGLHPSILEPFRVNGELYGLTFDWNNIVAHINTNILEEVGLEMPSEDWTYDTFLEYAQKMTFERPDGTKVYGTGLPDYYFAMSGWLFNNGASILNEDMTEARINSPESVEVFQFLQDLIYKYEVAPRQGHIPQR